MSNFPKGIWYDKTRKRYRLRITENTRCIHLSYHKSLDEAVKALKIYDEKQSQKIDPTKINLLQLIQLMDQ